MPPSNAHSNRLSAFKIAIIQRHQLLHQRGLTTCSQHHRHVALHTVHVLLTIIIEVSHLWVSGTAGLRTPSRAAASLQ